ncbi:DeoR/GlpR family DNA-binding transcription regulator [Lactobacillus sp. LL6]|uniref:DeoR/GlpR family DNA-binding transcription regulator n=1 Tax=Lactobacillus sp. LL6 TaxID=2596827 RepID=UPI00118655A9|nr:DeoR/GlpR family DNA-binding transcription regulator [Lactobacillus sp. LL6]TSO26878.1 DeoR/GlpR transcriptional regulator [Lactobacillus sp. LL6]
MLTEERQARIADYINQNGLCKVSELCKLTDTSESTIRRDLIQMEKQGMLKRVHGGARSVKSFSRDVSQHVRFSLNHEDKLKVARFAAEHFVHSGDDIFIDAGTTTYEMVPFLAGIADLTIVTNGVETVLCSLNHGINTILVGGKIKDDTHASVGHSAQDQIKSMNFTASFIGTNGIDKDGKLSTPDPEEAAVKRTEIAQAEHAYVLADKSKIGEQNFAVFGNIKDTVLITNKLNQREKAAMPADIKIEEV